MKAILRNLLAVIVGLIAGSCVNMGLILLGSKVVPPPAGMDVTSAESIRASIHLFEPRHFVFPFLAHALGTLVGAAVAYAIASCRRGRCAFGVGIIFLAGGIAAASMIPAPTWFVVLDLVGAYLPMAALGAYLGCRFVGGTRAVVA